MAEEKNEALKNDTPELDDAKLSEANGGSVLGDLLGWSSLKRIHRGCGGTVCEGLPSILSTPYSYFCSKCFENHKTLEEFDYYIEGMESPIF